MNRGDTTQSLVRFSHARKKFLASFVLFSLAFASPLSVFGQVANLPVDTEANPTQPSPVIESSAPVKKDVIAGPSEKEWSLLGLPRFPEIKPVRDTPSNEAATLPGTKIVPEDKIPAGKESSGGVSALASVAANKWLNSYSDSIRLPEPEHVSGAFTQDVPIVTPPGRNGVEPSLKLSYKSQDRDGENLFGLGWSLNIPIIERMNKSGSEDLYSQQYFISSFDGELSTTSSSTYGAKFDDGSFRNYSFASSTSIWTMTDKAGVKYTFGTTTTGRLSNPNNSSQVYRWMLEEMRDTNGNFMKYEYTKDNAQIYPSKITYTGNGGLSGLFEVSFVTESRSDNPIVYKYGFLVKTLYRIKEIDIKFNGNLVKKYVLAFTTGHNGVKSLLQSVTETGYDEAGTPTALPPMTFTYQASNTSWPQTTDSPWNLPDITDVNWKDTGFRVLDYNNNSLSDSLLLKEGVSPSGYEYQNSWSGISVSQTAPALVDSSGNDRGSALVDVNGDGHTDIVLGKDGFPNPLYNTVYLRSGTSFVATTYSNTPYLVDADGNDNGIRFGDFNGDGYPDYLRGKAGLSYYLFLNKADGTGWADGVGVFGNPEQFVDVNGNDYGARVMDVNGDGLDDIVTRTDTSTVTRVNFNLGGGTNWSTSDIPNTSQYAGPQITGANGKDIGTRMTDVNSDGLIDFVVSTPTRGIHFYINRGTGAGSDPWGWVDLSIGAGSIPYFLDTSDRDIGVRMVQANYDGIPDFVRGGYNTTKNNYISSGDPVDVLTSVTFPSGGNTLATYKGVDAETSLLRVVKTIARDPGLGATVATTTYTFIGGQFQTDWQNRKFRGFDEVDEIDSLNNYMVTNYHQGNGDNIYSPYPWNSYAQGEYDDIEAKMYRPWRIQKITPGVGTSNIAINRWEKKDLGGGRTLVYLKDAIQYDYDLNSSHKDSASSFDYATSTGNLISTINWGEVTGNTSDGTWGTWSDTGNDKRTTTLAYATGGSYAVTGAPSQSTLTNQSGTKVSETKNYYDNLAFGSVQKGNLTKQELWKTGSLYASTTKIYDSTYGNVTQEKDARGNATNYIYDSYNLFVATSTNALSQARGFQYDYSSGNVKQLTDENNRVFQTTYDGLDRVKEEKQPDITTPTTLVTKSLYTYTDTPLAVSMKKTSYLNSATSTDSYEYKDGLGRTLQTRAQAEGSNFSARDFAYNNRGLLDKESLPYFSTGSAKTSPTGTTALYTNYTYDALGRVTQASNAVGNTTNAYDDWKVTTTDANGKTKDFTKDAYGNLATVVERDGASNYTTTYEYNLLKNLTKITDANGNVRNFTYDGLGRRLTAQDLHATSDGSYGTWTYTYDDASNMTRSVDPKNQTVNYVYDSLNRALTEDYTGASGTEITYGYDTCANGKTRLCSATTTSVTTTRTYNPLGFLGSETETINGSVYTTAYSYDRQGNQTLISYPDTSEARYTYGNAGFVNKVEQRDGNWLSFRNITKSIDYNPLGLETQIVYANGATTTNTYDAAKLYRLSDRVTILPDITGDQGSGSGALMMMSSAGEGGAPADFSSPVDQNNLPGSMKRTLKTEGSWKKEGEKHPSDEVFTFITPPISFSQPVSPEERKFSNEMSKKSNIEQPTPLPFFPKEYIGVMLLGAGIPTESDNMNTENLWLSESITNNHSFENGFNFWGFWTNSGATRSEDCTVAYSGTCSEKIVVPTAGSSWSPTLSHILRIDPGMNYILKFKAKASATTTFEFNVGQNYGNYLTYGIAKTGVSISPAWKEYEYRFTSSAPSIDENSRIYFGLGAVAATYWIDDVELVPDQLTRTTNPGFENGSSPWAFWANGGSSRATNSVDCAVAYSGDCSNKTIVNQSGTDWYVQLNQEVSLATSTTYMLTFDAKASVTRDVSVILGQNHDPYNTFSSAQTFTLYPDWNKYVIEITSSGGDNQGRFVFQLGVATSTVYFDNVKFWKKTNTKISTVSPKFTAIFDDPDGAGETASAYQVQVIVKGGSFSSPLWDSAKTALSPQTAEGARIASSTYVGPTLPMDGKKYFWRIKLWDSSDNASPWTNGRDYFTTSGNRVQDLHYTYDANGNITKIDDTSNTRTEKSVNFTYDDLSRLTSASTTNAVTVNFSESYAYSPLGNLTSKTGAGNYSYAGTNYANPHAPTSIGGTPLTYDNNGNQTGNGSSTYAFDYRNRMTDSTVNSAASSYSYDSNNERAVIAQGSSATHYPNTLYNISGPTPIKHIFLNGNMLATVQGGWGNGILYYTHTDHLTGSNVVSDSGAHLAELTDYLPYGLIRTDDRINGYAEQRKYAGTEYDNATSLNYMGARYYDGTRGQFISQDPSFLGMGVSEITPRLLVDPQQQNSYSYARNNPLRYADPTGEAISPVDLGITLAAIAIDLYRLNNALSSGQGIKEASASLSLSATGLIPGIPAFGAISRIQKLTSETRGADTFLNAGKIKPVHGNSLESTKLNTGYTLRDAEGNILKYGETARPGQRYSQKFLDGNGYRFKPEVIGSKRDIHDWQHNQILDYKVQYNGIRPLLNKSDW